MHIGVWRSLVALRPLQSRPFWGKKKRKTFKHAFLFFLSPFRGRLFPLLSVTRLFEIVTRSCLDISISRHPLSAIAIPSLLFAPLLSNLVTPTNAGFACRGTKKRESAARSLLFFVAVSLLFAVSVGVFGEYQI